MAKPRDSKFNKKYSFIDRAMPKASPGFHDWNVDKDWRTCEACDGTNQRPSEHLRLYHDKFRCAECRQIFNVENPEVIHAKD